MSTQTFQEISPASPQEAMEFALPEQPGISFPLSLAEKYQPRHISDLVGLDQPTKILSALAANPRPCAMLFVGAPGIGKSVAGLCFADDLGGALVHISSQKCDVATLDELRDRFAYCPPGGKFWVCLVDEADQMSAKAQVQLLSRLDSTASLRPTFGGAAVRGEQPPIIWIFTANGLGKNGIIPPPSLEPRFLSRCMVIPFRPLDRETIAAYLRTIWEREGGSEMPGEYFDFMATGGGIRDALMRLQVDLLTGPRSIEIPEPVEILPARRRPFLVEPTAASRSAAALKAWETRRQRSRANAR